MAMMVAWHSSLTLITGNRVNLPSPPSSSAKSYKCLEPIVYLHFSVNIPADFIQTLHHLSQNVLDMTIVIKLKQRVVIGYGLIGLKNISYEIGVPVFRSQTVTLFPVSCVRRYHQSMPELLAVGMLVMMLGNDVIVEIAAINIQ